MKIISCKKKIIKFSITDQEVQELYKLLKLALKEEYLLGDAGINESRFIEMESLLQGVKENQVEMKILLIANFFDLIWTIRAQGVPTLHLNISKKRLDELENGFMKIMSMAGD